MGAVASICSRALALGGPCSDVLTAQSTPSPLTSANTQQTTGSNMFASLGGNTQPAQTQAGTASNMFASLGGTSQPAKSSTLFGSLGGASQPASTSSSMFGSLGGTSQPANTTGNLFGGLGGTSQPANTTSNLSSGLGGSTQASSQPANNVSFGASLLNPIQNQEAMSRSQQQQPNGLGAQLSQSTINPAYFDHLLERGKKRANENGQGGTMFGELPQLQLGLADIARKVRKLGKDGPSAAQARGSGSGAHYLLSASGVNTSAALKDLYDLSASAAARPAAAPAASSYDLDLDSYVDNIYQQQKQEWIDDSLARSKKEFNDYLEETLQDNREARMQKIYEHFGLKKAKAGDDLYTDDATPPTMERSSFGKSSRMRRSMNGQSFGISGLNRSVIGTPGPRGARTSMFGDIAEKVSANGGMHPAPEDRLQREKQDKLGERVKNMNVARLQETVYPICKEFAEIEALPSNEDTLYIKYAYDALIQITGENVNIERASDPGAVKERQYAQDYLDDAPNSRGRFNVKKRIINGSRQFLEQLAFKDLEQVIERNATIAKTGGNPATIHKVRGYIRVKVARKELGPDVDQLQNINGDYTWVMVYHLLRCGLLKEAQEYVAENERAIKASDRNFPTFLTVFAKSDERRLTPELQTRINSEYSQRMRLSPEDQIDPYRMACYKIIGRCDLGRKTLEGINANVEDWAWMQFALAREVNRVEEVAGEVYSLDDVQESIRKIGERHFGPGQEGAAAPATFFFMQILAGMFEKAVQFLYPHNYLSATHFAIALDFYGLLRVSDYSNSEDLLSYTIRQQPQLAFGVMIGLYTRDFRTSNATLAADYISLICLNADLPGSLGKAQKDLCHEALTELVLETRDFAELLGDIRFDGVRIKGAIEQRLKLIKIDDEQTFMKKITMDAARTAEESGRITDAVLLFHLAEEYDKVIEIVNGAVSEALTTELGQQPTRLDPLKPRQTSSGQPEQSNSSLSLVAVDDPIELAKGMKALYDLNATYYSKIRSVNRDACRILLMLAEAKKRIEAGRWSDGLDVSFQPKTESNTQTILTNEQAMESTRLLPLSAQGNISVIRNSANAFNALPTVLSRTIGTLLVWTVLCCGNQREHLRASEFGNTSDMPQICLQIAKDTMVFAGLVRYKLSPKVWDVLARAGQEVGAY